jgi:SAM-dependent methyltransferase
VDTVADARRVLDEAAASGLDLSRLPGNPAKLRLQLDLARQLATAGGTLRVLDVGAGGRNEPFNLWEPFLPLAGQLELVGVDVAHLEETRARAHAIGFPVELRSGSADELVSLFGAAAFDAVVSTQVLEHLRDWPGALREMRDVLRPGGLLYATCDSGDLRLGTATATKLAGKRAYARAGEHVPGLRRALEGVASGEWERGPTAAAVEREAVALRLEIELLRHYGIRDLKDMQTRAGSAGRLLWLAYEESLADGDPGLHRLLYLRARRARGGA